MAIPKWLGPWLVGAGLISVALAVLIAVRAFVHVRRAEYYVVREQARQTGLRAIVMVFLLSLLTLVLLFLPRQAPPSHEIATPTSVTPAQTTTAPTVQATFTAAAPATTLPQPTATEPFIPTSTPQATLPPVFTSPLPSAVPPPGDARLEFWTLARGVDENNQPVGPSTTFEQGIERVYLFFRYDGLLPNAPWTVVWYQNGELLSGGTDLWAAERSAGEWYVYLTLDGGYSAGDYEVQVWLGERLQIRTRFSVVPGGAGREPGIQTRS